MADKGAWIELAFTGEVPLEATAEFAEAAAELAERHGLTLASGICFSEEENYPGTWVLWDVALRALAKERGVPVEQVQAELEQAGRDVIVATAAELAATSTPLH